MPKESFRTLAIGAKQFVEKAFALPERLRTPGRVEAVFTDREISDYLAVAGSPQLRPRFGFDIEEFRLPPKVQDLQVHITPEAVRLDCRYNELWLRRPVISTYIRPEVFNGALTVSRVKVYAGRLPIRSEREVARHAQTAKHQGFAIFGADRKLSRAQGIAAGTCRQDSDGAPSGCGLHLGVKEPPR
jgi:hypothetical protein